MLENKVVSLFLLLFGESKRFHCRSSAVEKISFKSNSLCKFQVLSTIAKALRIDKNFLSNHWTKMKFLLRTFLRNGENLQFPVSVFTFNINQLLEALILAIKMCNRLKIIKYLINFFNRTDTTTCVLCFSHRCGFVWRFKFSPIEFVHDSDNQDHQKILCTKWQAGST